MAQSGAVFSYWHGPGRDRLSAMQAEWRAGFAGFAIHSDAEAMPLLAAEFPQHLQMVQALNIPAARSDIMRLLLLHAQGGLYVDTHCGLRDAGAVRALLAGLAQHQMIVVGRAQTPVQEGMRMLRNGILFARPGLPLLREIAAEALDNLAFIWRAGPDEPYDIWSLCGPGLLARMLGEPAAMEPRLRAPYRAAVRIVPEDGLPISIGTHRNYYQDKSSHWSQRQRREPLFDPI